MVVVVVVVVVGGGGVSKGNIPYLAVGHERC